MNELIEELHNMLTRARFPMGTISIDDIRIIVQTACQAQRNACKRVYADNLFDDTYTAIGNAKIRREDYE